jgi:hypothetical protein
MLAEADTERLIDHILERQPELSRALLQEAGQIVIDGERSAHGLHHGCDRI